MASKDAWFKQPGATLNSYRAFFHAPADNLQMMRKKVPESSLGAAPPWVRLATEIVRRLPAGRYRIMDWMCSRPPKAFWARMPAELGGYSFRCDLRDCICREV